MRKCAICQKEIRGRTLKSFKQITEGLYTYTYYTYYTRGGN